MNKPLGAALALVLSVAMIPAHAERPSVPPGFTISATGMYVITADSKFSSVDDEGDQYDGTTTFGSGFGGSFALGYEVNPSIRGEVELSYRRSEIDDETYRYEVYQPIRISGIDGHMSSFSIMGNAIYTFNAGRLRPYLGAGIGIARVGWDSDAQTATRTTAGESTEVSHPAISEYEPVFGYQAMAGVGFAVTESTEVRAGYRYMQTEDIEVNGDDTSYATHNIEAGVVFRF